MRRPIWIHRDVVTWVDVAPGDEAQISLYCMKDVLPRRFVFYWFPLLLVSLGSGALAQVLEHKKPTEQLIKRYEKLIADGALLSPEGWARACKFFERPSPYPANSEIDVRSAPGIIGEATPNGNRTEIGSKWRDFYGTIDFHLQFKGTPVGQVL